MRLAYIDESYDRERFVLAAVVVDGSAAAKLCVRLDDDVMWAHRRFGVSATAEIHAHPLLNRRGDWAGMPEGAALGLRLLRRVLLAAADARAETIVVERSLAPDVGGPSHTIADTYRACLDRLIKEVDLRAQMAGTHVAVVADDVAGADDYREAVLVHRRAPIAAAGTSRIVDTIYFAPSRSSRMLQAADVVSYVARRMLTERASGTGENRATGLWSIVAPLARFVTIPGSASAPEDRG